MIEFTPALQKAEPRERVIINGVDIGEIWPIGERPGYYCSLRLPPLDALATASSPFGVGYTKEAAIESAIDQAWKYSAAYGEAAGWLENQLTGE